jgi:hypothetical protein
MVCINWVVLSPLNELLSRINHILLLFMFSWLVRCKKGDPEGCNNGTWVIERLKYNGDDCYVLCTKDSNGNCLSAGYTRRLHGKRGVINKKRMWLIRKSNLNYYCKLANCPNIVRIREENRLILCYKFLHGLHQLSCAITIERIAFTY